MSRTNKSRKGFTLVELAVVIVIIGVLAAFGVPQFLKSVERSKAAEAFNCLSALSSAQERFIAKNGVYWGGTIATADGAMAAGDGYSGTDVLDIKQQPPKYFGGSGDGATPITVKAVQGSATVGEGAEATQNAQGGSTWYCALSRLTASTSYSYIVAFDQDGYLPPTSNTATCRNNANGDSTIPSEINPMGS
jgi:prepilin-type N-terminal cleavage/methylation domain-containing protein